MENELPARQTTKVVLVHFSGDETLSYDRMNKQSLRKGISETGYHYIIERDGKLLMGRHQSKVGSHYQEYDAMNVGIWVAANRDDMSEEQSVALTLILDKLQADYSSSESIKYVYRTE